MATTISDAFDVLLSWLTPTGTETDAAKGHRASIKDCLAANLGITAFFRSGSFGNGTSISGYSDLDFFSVIPNGSRWPTSDRLLSDVLSVLQRRFTTTIGIRIDCPAVYVPFGQNGSESTEIVPALIVDQTWQGEPIYAIANCNNGWQRSSPRLHNDYVWAMDQRLDGKVKPLIRFIKAWKYYNNLPISSFYLEMFVAMYAEGEPSIVYPIDIANVLSQLSRNQLAPFLDPVGVAGSISACSNFNDQLRAQMKLPTAASLAQNARDAGQQGYIERAFSLWNTFYNGEFPKYY